MPCHRTSSRRNRGAFHGISCPFDVVSSRSPLPRVCLARYVPLPGFRNLLAACSSSNLVGLFHPTDIHGIPSFRAFSSTRAVTPRRCPMPSCRYPPCGLGALGFPSIRTVAAFRALLTWRARSGPVGCYSSRSADALLDLILSRVFRPRRWPGLHRASSRASTDPVPREGRRACLHSGVSLVRGRGLLSLESAFPF